jgi:hypothetical protein
MNKKGESMSLNVIIIAAIALIVLVVLILIFTGRIHLFAAGVSACTNSGGKCTDIGTYNSGDEACKAINGQYSTSVSADCTKTVNDKQVTDSSKVCCVTATG